MKKFFVTLRMASIEKANPGIPVSYYHCEINISWVKLGIIGRRGRGGAYIHITQTTFITQSLYHTILKTFSKQKSSWIKHFKFSS